MILQKGGGTHASAFIIFLYFGIGMTSAAICTYRSPNCVGDNCIEEQECYNGQCTASGQCQCLPCYKGESCSDYEDKYSPRFPVRDDVAIISPHHQGVIYKATAEDEDLGLTCPLGPGDNSRCPCAAVFYRVRDEGRSDSVNFTMDELSGQLFLKQGVSLQAGGQYTITIIASSEASFSSTGRLVQQDVLTLRVTVLKPDPLQDLLGQKSYPETVPIGSNKAIIEKAYEDDEDGELPTAFPPSALQPHIREKRDSAGVAGDTGASKLTLVELTSPPATLKPGNSIDFQLTVVLPTLDTAMDLVIEVFVMDAVSGISPFALCAPVVDSIGSEIKDQDGNALDVAAINAGVDKKVNDEFKTFYDRAVFDFGQVLNGDTPGNGVDNAGPSTITISFTAVLIKNTNYVNDTVVVTAGAEYDSEKFVWVSQAAYPFEMEPTETYTSSFSMTGPDELPEWTGGTYEVTSIITNPFETLIVEVYSINEIHDLFTVTQVTISKWGANWVCMIDDASTIRYYDSATGRTVHRVRLESPLLLKNLDYSDLGTAATSPANGVDISFTIFAMDAKVDDLLMLGAGIMIGDQNIWTGAINVTVTAGSLTPTDGAPTAWEVVPLTSTTVGNGGTATWGGKATITASDGVMFDCSVTGDADNKVCGISYGTVGTNIAYLPNLTELVTYNDDGSAAFQVYINSTGPGSVSTSNDITFEVSVNYPTGSPGSVTWTCNGGLSETLAATLGTRGVLDMTGVSTSLTTDTTWYDGSQAGLLVKLTFPVNSAPYTSLIMETAGDLSVSGWGAKVCKAEVVSAGRGVPCIAGNIDNINSGVEMQQSKDDSVFDDSAKMEMGSACGTNRLSSSSKDYEVIFKVYYQMPPGQALSADGEYNMSVGISLSDDIIWTGWNAFAFTTSPPAYDSTKPPVFNMLPIEDGNSVDIGIPQFVRVTLKTPPGSVSIYKVTAEVDDPAILSICKIIFLAVGSNFPCVDTEPYGKEDEPYQVTTLIHDPDDWGKRAVLNLGALRNLGSGDIYSEVIADEDSIHLGIFVKGMSLGTGTLSVILDDNGPTPTTLTQEYIVSATEPDDGTLTAVAQGTDGTDVAYEGVMKMIDLKLQIPERYAKVVTVTITNTNLKDITVCFGAVFEAGDNLPCVIPSQTTSNRTVTDSEEVLVIEVKQVCHYKMSSNASEDEITIRIGAMFLEGSGPTATVSAVIKEGTVDLSPVTFTMTKSSSDFDPGNITTEGMKLELLDNTTTTVVPGLRFKTAVAFTIPKGVTTPFEVGIMTTSDEGRAYVTVHGFSFRSGGGKNLGCLMSDCSLYKPTIIQNSSLSIPLIHTSQTDTVVADLKYITNTGLTHMHMVPKPEDDQVWLEADLMIADHPNATAGGEIFDISFAVKAGSLIFVIEKELVNSRSGGELPVIGTELYLTDDTTTVFLPKQQVSLTGRMYHDMNVSQEEANQAVMRVYLPKYLTFVNDTTAPDEFSANITGNLIVKNYIDYDLTHLFFTDILEVNFSVTVDPNEELPKGLGLINGTTIMRLICSTNNNPVLRYCGNTSYVIYQIQGPECYDSLNVANMQDCQLSASTAIRASQAPAKAKFGSGAGWSPAVRPGAELDHFITIDFLKMTRVTKIVMEKVTSSRETTKFKLQYSHSGAFFQDACPNELEVPLNKIILLPDECKFEARYGRMLIVEADGAEGSAPIGVRFEWYGCPIATEDGQCNPSLTTTMTDSTRGWRHVALDSTNGILYFCDFMPKKKRVGCFSSVDGIVWNALPSYIGRLVGFDATTGKMYAFDRKDRAMVSSADGINWSIVDTATASTMEASITDANRPAAVPGDVEARVDPVTVGGWTADYTGLQFGGAYVAKWANCCS